MYGALNLNNFTNQIKIELHGDWGRARHTLRTLPLEMLEASVKAQETVARKYKKKLIHNMRTNRFGYSLSPDYMFYKANKGGDPTKAGYWTGLYTQSIIIEKGRTRVNVRIREGIRYSPPDHGRKRSPKLTIDQIAIVLEKGSASRGISPKPFWRDTYLEMGGRRGIGSTFVRSLSQRVRSRVRGVV
jgi:hypothetical protein